LAVREFEGGSVIRQKSDDVRGGDAMNGEMNCEMYGIEMKR